MLALLEARAIGLDRAAQASWAEHGSALSNGFGADLLGIFCVGASTTSMVTLNGRAGRSASNGR